MGGPRSRARQHPAGITTHGEGDDFLSAWAGLLGERAEFPRDVIVPATRPDGKLARRYILCLNMQEYLAACAEWAAGTDVWVSQVPASLYGAGIRTRLFIDLDGSLEDTQARALRIARHLEDEHGVWPACTFSANRSYHLLLDHDVVWASRGSFRDAALALLDGAHAGPDPQPLMNERSGPRLPGSLNGKSFSTHGRGLYVTPCDPTEPLASVLAASEARAPRALRVPHAQGLGATLQGLVGEPVVYTPANPEEERARREKVVRHAIAFCEKKAGRFTEDGRRRVLLLMYVPALLHHGDTALVEERCQGLVEGWGLPWEEYREAVRAEARRLAVRDRLPLPMSIRNFLAKNPDLSYGLKADVKGTAQKA